VATTNELTCQELVELVTDYLEGDLSVDERMRFENHLAGCTGCRRYLDQMRRTIDSVGRLRADDLPPAIRDELLALFRSWKQSQGDA
jgi:anti-sigma factor RsiW